MDTFEEIVAGLDDLEPEGMILVRKCLVEDWDAKHPGSGDRVRMEAHGVIDEVVDLLRDYWGWGFDRFVVENRFE